MRILLKKLQAFTSRPHVMMSVSGVLLVTSSVEVWEGLDELLAGEGSIGVHHGIAFYALFQFLKAIPEIFESAKLVEESNESPGEHHARHEHAAAAAEHLSHAPPPL